MATTSRYSFQLALTAKVEYETFRGIPETDKRLYKRIYKTYLPALGLKEPRDISSWAWSAVFVSWCVKAAGAADGEFAFADRHAIYTKRAIEDGQNNSGVFHGRELGKYAPKVGDIIVKNRERGRVSFDEAATRNDYPSHGAIVVDLQSRAGKNYAITVGGNESDTVGRREIELTSDGFVAQTRFEPYICVIEALKPDGAISAPAAARAPSPAVRKHGTFFYDVPATITQYGSAANVATAMQRAGMSHAWVRIHGTTPYSSAAKRIIAELIDKLKASNISVAGWGWCQGADVVAEARMAAHELAFFQLNDYLADIEQGVNNARWSVMEIDRFCAAVRQSVDGAFGITTFPLIDWHEPQLMEAAIPYVDLFAPQVYWFNFPNAKMVRDFRRPDGTLYKANDPAEYADLCLDRWMKLIGPSGISLVITGQTYWGEGSITQEDAEAKFRRFLSTWNSYGRVVGINWWHFGGHQAMSHDMLEQIIAADLSHKPFAT